MTKTSKLFIFGGLAILIIGLAIGAYFFFQAADEVKERLNDAGQLHREGDLPARIGYYESGEIQSEAWFSNGQKHRGNDRPAWINYDESGEIEHESWYLNSELIKTQPPSL